MSAARFAVALVALVLLGSQLSSAATAATSRAQRSHVTVANDTAYNESLAHTLLALSAAAYCEPPTLLNWSCAPCLNISETPTFIAPVVNDDTNIHAYLAYLPTPQALVLAFRGTSFSSVKNWIEDLLAIHSKPSAGFPGLDPSASVDAGFLDAYSSIAPNMTALMIQALKAYNVSTLIFTGHSLGAAMAELAALDIFLNHPANVTLPPMCLYNYGQPRVGNSAYAKQFANNVTCAFRVVHHDDIVPHAPPPLFGYEFGSIEIWYPHTNMTRGWESCSPEDPKCSDSVPPWDWSLHDHEFYFGVEVAQSCSSF